MKSTIQELALQWARQIWSGKLDEKDSHPEELLKIIQKEAGCVPIPLKTMKGRVLLKLLDTDHLLKSRGIIIPDGVKKIDPIQYKDHPFQGYVVAMNPDDFSLISLMDRVYLGFPATDIVNCHGIIYHSVPISQIAAIVL